MQVMLSFSKKSQSLQILFAMKKFQQRTARFFLLFHSGYETISPEDALTVSKQIFSFLGKAFEAIIFIRAEKQRW